MVGVLGCREQKLTHYWEGVRAQRIKGMNERQRARYRV